MSTMNGSALQDFVGSHQRLFVLTGAGCSTNSGIPDYRDSHGNWKRTPPVTYQAFMGDEATRQRYWARSLVGWRRFGRAQPNDAHRALAQLEAQGRCELLDLHGRLDLVRCMGCGAKIPRQEFQQEMEHRNADWLALDAADAPDGDADLESEDFSSFDVPCCASCGGILKPDVVFFGENVPRDIVVAAHDRLEQADAMLIVGSSLMVYSGFRFVRSAAQRRIPIAAINLGRTRADDLLTLKVEDRCEAALGFLLD